MQKRRVKLLVAAAVGLLVALPLVGANGTDAESQPEPDDGIDVYFRDVDLGALAEQDLAVYGDAEPGDSERFAKAFVGAPPQIPHSLEDLLPISGKENQCLECHLPENAEDMEAVAIPKTHFFRPTIVGLPIEDGTESSDAADRVVVGAYEAGTELSGFHYHCVQCHTPQAENVTEPVNVFVSEGQ